MNKIFIGYGLKSEGRNLCIINILRSLLLEGVAIKLNNYELGGVKVVTEGEHRTNNAVRVINLLSNKETFNISANCAVTTYMEKKTDNGVTLEEETIYRTYNIVRDGKVLVKSITISNLNNEVFELLRNANVLFYSNGSKVMENHMFNENMEYVVRFDNLAIVSQSWAQPKNIGLVALMMEDADLSEKLSALRKLIKEYKESVANNGESKSEYNTHTEEAKETYEVSCVVYDLPNYRASKVSVDDIRYEYPNLESANAAFKNLSDRQRDIRFVSRCVIMAIENAKSDCGMVWDALAPMPRSKNKMCQTCSFDGQVVRRIEYKKTVEK